MNFFSLAAWIRPSNFAYATKVCPCCVHVSLMPRATPPAGSSIGKRLERISRIFASRNAAAVAKQPKPYLRLRRKLIDEASAKYLVGHVTSAITCPCHRISSSIWKPYAITPEKKSDYEKTFDDPLDTTEGGTGKNTSKTS